MIHLLAVLTGAALMLSAALRIVSSDLDRGIPAPLVRFIGAGMLLAASPEAIQLLGTAFTPGSDAVPAGPAIAACIIAGCIAAVLPHDPAAYKDLLRIRPDEVASS